MERNEKRVKKLMNYLLALARKSFYGKVELTFENGLLVHFKKIKSHKGEELDD